jgi:hypothetical protein
MTAFVSIDDECLYKSRHRTEFLTELFPAYYLLAI